MRRASTQQRFAQADGWRQADDGLERDVVRRLGPAESAHGLHFPRNCPWPMRSCIDNQPSHIHQSTQHIGACPKQSCKLLHHTLYHDFILEHLYTCAHQFHSQYASEVSFSPATSSIFASTIHNRTCKHPSARPSDNVVLGGLERY